MDLPLVAIIPGTGSPPGTKPDDQIGAGPPVRVAGQLTSQSHWASTIDAVPSFACTRTPIVCSPKRPGCAQLQSGLERLTRSAVPAMAAIPITPKPEASNQAHRVATSRVTPRPTNL